MTDRERIASLEAALTETLSRVLALERQVESMNRTELSRLQSNIRVLDRRGAISLR